ncbi:OmpA family protein [Streptomyces meridianus]|uniref:OmpA family protein n=1 Tax=Streptomyces meridianus TaxID=2938945 RepID=A0ABT0X1B4_9ACTN|nr:OmpA family protein [Streptomyces meridianus]MCM2576308.1 OmpA family protein [Streptomyces meridianus]
MTTTHLNRNGVIAALAVAAVLATGTLSATTAQADDGPGAAATSVPPVKVDPEDPDLRMVDGARLAPAKVLDIKQVVESDGGDERREDTNSDIKFALQAEVLFGKDSAKLGGDANVRINEVAEEIDKQGSQEVRVFGFTDNLGSSAHGDTLSKQRANAVQKVLAKKLGSGVTFEIRGYGERFPTADNSTEEGRKKNRRVEISFPRGDG